VDDPEMQTLLAAIDDPDLHMAVAAERAFLSALGAGCTLPVAAHATVAMRTATARATGRKKLRLEGMIASGDGRIVVRGALEGDDPDRLGLMLAAELLGERGAGAIEGWEAAG